MVEILRGWLLGLVAAALILTVLRALVPKGSIRPVARVTAGLVLLLVLLRPLAGLGGGSLRVRYDELEREITARIEDYQTLHENELESIIDTVEDEGVIDEEKCDLIQSVFDFEDVQAYEIITPRVDMLAIDADSTRQEILDKILSSSFTRIPVYRDTVDNIIGILHVNRVLKELSENADCDLLTSLMPAVFVYKTMPLDDVLAQMRKNNAHMTVVTDEYGGVMGILTMEDVLEQLVGDIWDESDIIEPEITELADGSFEVDGDMRIEDLFDELDFYDKEFDDDNATVGGFVVELLEHYARKNDVAYYKNIAFTVTKTKKHRVSKIHVELLSEQQEDENN